MNGDLAELVLGTARSDAAQSGTARSGASGRADGHQLTPHDRQWFMPDRHAGAIPLTGAERADMGPQKYTRAKLVRVDGGLTCI